MKKLEIISVWLLAALLVAGCDSKDKPDTSAPKLPPKKSKPASDADGSAAATPSESAGQDPAPSAEKPEPSGNMIEGGNVDFESMSKKVKDTGTLGMPGFSDVSALNSAMRSFAASHKEPLTSLQQLVDAKLIRSLPVPPPGKKYVIDMKLRQVTLQNK